MKISGCWAMSWFMACSTWAWKVGVSAAQLLLGETYPRRLHVVGGGVG